MLRGLEVYWGEEKEARRTLSHYPSVILPHSAASWFALLAMGSKKVERVPVVRSGGKGMDMVNVEEMGLE
jgi:hypothetical protein